MVELTNLILHRKDEASCCSSCVRVECERAMHQAWLDEQTTWKALEGQCLDEWMRLDRVRVEEYNARVRLDRRMADLAHFHEVVHQHPLPLSTTRHAELIVEHLGTSMMMEIRDNGPLPPLNQRRLPLQYACDYFIAFNSNYGVHFATNGYALLLVDDDWLMFGGRRLHAAIKHVWRHYDIPREHVIAVRSDYIVRRLADIQRAHLDDKQPIRFGNCLFPLLKECEDEHQNCANCGESGHRSHACTLRICARCKRQGHLAGACFAKRMLDGTPL